VFRKIQECLGEFRNIWEILGMFRKVQESLCLATCVFRKGCHVKDINDKQFLGNFRKVQECSGMNVEESSAKFRKV
jgi:hypothetical protein